MTTLELGAETDETLDRLMQAGRFASRENAVAEALALLEQSEAAWAELDEALMQGIRSADAGRLIPAHEVADEMRRRYPAVG